MSAHLAGMHFTPSIRPSHQSDVSAVTEIYAHYVLRSTASFEIVPPDEREMAHRREQVLDRGLPYLVAEIDKKAVAYAYAVPYRPRPAYRFTVEDSIYVHPDYIGKGIGRLLLAALINGCEKASCRQMIAVIGGKDTSASVRLHHAFGFLQVGVLKAVGFKFGAWADTVLMQRALSSGDTTAPDDTQVLAVTP